ncbi:MAG TPA: VWA domain-containing protein [Xanthobacteraceae bacterium]|jgi:Flp pilus assembly protein TadG|nr:VWA domain-containing protein [Xanthobacteraceae bacterium]
MMFRNAVRFAQDRRGNIGPIFALSLLPATGMVGAAVDYTRANDIRAALQASLDSTTLAMAQKASGLSPESLNTQAKSYFNAVFKKPGATGVQLTLDYSTTNGPKLVMTGATTVKTQFMNLPGLGIPYIAVSASSTSKWSNARLRVALALDNTGSMAQSGKMPALKTAAKNLIDQLSAASVTPGDVYVSIIPFSRDVNVGTGNVNASWLRWSGGTNPNGSAATDSWDDLNGTCTKSANNRQACEAKGTCSISGYNNSGSCTNAGLCSISGYSTQNGCTTNGVCSKSWLTSQSSCSSGGGTWTQGQWSQGTWTPATWTPANHSTWTGCVMDRDQSYDSTNAAPTAGIPGTLFPTEQYADCPVEILPLTYNWTSLKSKIDAMTPKGNTNTTIGLEWAWHSLTAGSPLSAPPEDTNYEYKKVIIFLTDGDNTENRFTDPSHTALQKQTLIDDRMKLACANAKDPASVNGNVEIYTILVIQGTASLLETCSSNASDHYFKITSANELVTVFKQIGAKLAKLHVAQ